VRMGEDSNSFDTCLDTDSFPAFAPLLEACQDYAQLSGCRFVRGALQEFETCNSTLEDKLQGEKLSAMRKAAPLVALFKHSLLLPRADGSGELRDTVARAYRLVMTESVRNGISATCREFDLWPPKPAPAGISDDDCAYEDTAAPLAVIAQRIYNDELRRSTEDAFKPLLRRAATASFIVDFATEVGADLPALSELHQQMLEEFMSRVAESSAGHHSEHGRSSIGARARKAFLAGIGPGGGVEGLRSHVEVRWAKNWESTGGTILNVAMVGVAMLAGAATMHRVVKRGLK